jgi:hypothetical protein
MKDIVYVWSLTCLVIRCTSIANERKFTSLDDMRDILLCMKFGMCNYFYKMHFKCTLEDMCSKEVELFLKKFKEVLSCSFQPKIEVCKWL